jgi:hypothetical protein
MFVCRGERGGAQGEMSKRARESEREPASNAGNEILCACEFKCIDSAEQNLVFMGRIRRTASINRATVQNRRHQPMRRGCCIRRSESATGAPVSMSCGLECFIFKALGLCTDVCCQNEGFSWGR